MCLSVSNILTWKLLTLPTMDTTHRCHPAFVRPKYRTWSNTPDVGTHGSVTHNSVGSALHTHRRDPDTRIQVGHTTNTQSQYTLFFNTQVRHVRSVRALGPEGPSRVLKLPVSRDAPAHSLTTHGAGACQPTQDRALGSILYFIPHSSPFSFEAARLSRTCPYIERVRPMSLLSPEVKC